MSALSTIVKANPLWDGDGVQGAGQPRNRIGRWVKLPGPTSLSRIGAFDLDDGTIGVFKDDDRRPMKKYKSKAHANKMVADAIKEDAREFKNEQRRRRRANKKIREAAEAERQREETAAAERTKEEQKRQREQERIFGTPKATRAKPKGVEQKGEKGRVSRKVTYSEVDRLPFPGRPTQAQMDAQKVWAKENLPDAEAKYSGLIARLLQRRGVTQDPSMRGDLAERYGISPKRQVEIEQATHEAMFPPERQRELEKPKLDVYQGRQIPTTRQQREAMEKLGARTTFPEADPENFNRPERYFKIRKGPKRGKWAKVSWNGVVSLVPKREGEREQRRSKVAWTQRFLLRKDQAKRMRDAYKAAQDAFREVHFDNAKQQKEWKVKRAQQWAEENGLDPDDSYWWGIFWQDSSMIRSQQGETDTPMSIALAEALIREKMDPAMLEGLLALPDIDARNIRGHRPGPKKATKGDEDFEEASALSREVDPDWEAQNREREIVHERRARAAYERYMKKYPNSKKTFAQFKNDYYNERMRIPGGSRKGISKSKNPRWDGDGVQLPGQPRNRKGEWSRGGGLSAVAGALQELTQTMQHHGSQPSRRAAAFDARRKTISADFKIKKPQKGSTHQQMAAGRPVKRTKKNWTPEQAYYARNNGPTKITDKRLREIYEDRSKITAAEHDLLTAAAGDARFDGTNRIKFRSVKAGGAQRELERWELIKNLRTQLAQDYAKRHGLATKGAGGQILTRSDDRAVAQREKDNTKRKQNLRNTYDKMAKRQELLDDFGDGTKARCIFCGKYVNLSTISPERMKPGPLGGKYERGNVAPAHVKCNTAMGTAAQYKPEEYYEAMMEQFLKNYKEWIDEGYLRFVFSKHRGKLKGKGRR